MHKIYFSSTKILNKNASPYKHRDQSIRIYEVTSVLKYEEAERN